MAWWNPAYARRSRITIPAAAGGYAAGTVISVALETRALIAAGAMRADRKDLRLVQNDTSEVARFLRDTGTILFRLQAPIAPNTADTSYALYFGNAGETSAPSEAPRNVWPAYLDGDDLGSLTVSGAAAYPFPKPHVLKVHANPTLVPTPGFGDQYGIRDCDGLLFDGVYFHVWYDADDNGEIDGILGWTAYRARSRDLLTWEKLGNQISPGGGPAGSVDTATASAMIVHKFQGDPNYYATYLGSPNVTAIGGIPNLPYILHGAAAGSLAGPWTKQGVLIPVSASGPYDSSQETADGMIYVPPGGGGFECVHGIVEGAGLRGCALATSPAPMGPWTKLKRLISGAPDQIENPRIVYDDASGYYFLIANHVGINADPNTYGTERTVSNVLYWSTDRLNWNLASKTSLIETDAGAWDSYVVGLASVPVIKDGMMYLAYDGANLAVFNQANSFTHRFRSSGTCELQWPPPWANGIKLTGPAATLQTGTLLTGDGTVRIRGRFPSSGPNGFGIKTAGHSYYVENQASSQDPESLAWFSYDGISTNIDGVKTGTEQQRCTNQTKNYDFIRAGSTLTINCNGITTWSGTVDTAPLSVHAYGDAAIEEVHVEPASTPSATAPATLSIDPPPTLGLSDTSAWFSGTCALGTQPTISASSGAMVPATMTNPTGTTWRCLVGGFVLGGPVTITATQGAESATATAVAQQNLADAVVDGALVGGTELDLPPLAPVIASPVNGAGFSAQSGNFALQATGCVPGALQEVWINGSPYTSAPADINGVAVAIVSWPLGADQAQAGDRAADAVRGGEAARDAGAAGTGAGAVVLGRETPVQGGVAGDAPGTGAGTIGEAPAQGGTATDVAAGFQQSVEVLRQQAAQGDISGDVFTPGGALAAPSVASPTSGADLTGLPGVMVQAIGANAGAILEFFINGQPAGSVGADVAGTAQWYLSVPWGSDAAQVGDREADVYTPAPTGTIVEALKDGATRGDVATDRVVARESTSDGGTVGDRAPQAFGESIADGAAATAKGTSAVISPLSLPLPKPVHARPLTAFLDADYVRACLFARLLPPYLRCGMSDIVYQGADRDIQFKLAQADADGNTIDYTSAQLHCGAQSGTGSRIPSDGTAINAVALTARARFIASTTASMIAGALYYYDGFVNLADGRILPVGNGSFTVRAPFTATP